MLFLSFLIVFDIYLTSFILMLCVWNVRGAGKKSLVKTLSDFRKIYRFEVLAVLEPRISGPRALSVANKLGFYSKFIVDADSFSGGLWLLWNNSSVSL